jgi:hypothetical protein
VIEFGRRYYTLLIEWTDWAAEQVAAGALQPGNPPPGVPSAAPVTVIPQNRTAKSSRP